MTSRIINSQEKSRQIPFQSGDKDFQKSDGFEKFAGIDKFELTKDKQFGNVNQIPASWTDTSSIWISGRSENKNKVTETVRIFPLY